MYVPDASRGQIIVKRLRLTHNHFAPPRTDPLDIDYEQKAKDWTTALRNFALVLIEPLEIDYVELAAVPNRRTHFWREKAEERGLPWIEEAVVP